MPVAIRSTIERVVCLLLIFSAPYHLPAEAEPQQKSTDMKTSAKLTLKVIVHPKFKFYEILLLLPLSVEADVILSNPHDHS